MADPACILLVEDEPLIAFALEDIILELGYRVVGPAFRLEDALDLARAGTFDAAILDVNLNEQQSFPIAALLEERGIPFLFATGYAEGNLSGFGNAAVIAKPYGRAQLARALASILA